MMTNVVEISWDQVISKMLYALKKMRITFLKWIKQQISFFQIGCFCLYDQAVIAWFTFFLNEMFLSTWWKLVAVGLFGLSQDERACLSQQAKRSLLISAGIDKPANLSKLILALQFFNSYGPEPIIARDEQLEADLCVTKLYKHTHVLWPGL